jgi:hypothetical protein
MLLELSAAVAVVAAGVALWRRPKPARYDASDPRVLKIVELRTRIRRNLRGVGQRELMSEQLAQVDAIVEGFCQLAAEEKRLAGYLRENPPALVQREIAQLEQRVAHGAEHTRAINQENLELLKLRLEKLEQADRTQDTIKARLDMLLDAVQLVKDQSLHPSQDGAEGVDIGRLTRAVASTDEALAEVRALLPTRS